MHILVVAADYGIRHLVRILLETDHYTVLAAANGADALDLAAAQPIDCALLAWHSSLVQHPPTRQALRRLTGPIPLIALAASPLQLDDLAPLGISDVVPMPFTPADLRAAVARCCAQRDLPPFTSAQNQPAS